jgi:hypothetical protein
MVLFNNQTPEEIVYITSRKISRELKDSEPEQKNPLDFKKISGIKKAAPELQKYIEDIDNNDTEDDDIIVGGSSAAFTQMKKFRVPKDLDITVPYLERVVQKIVSILKQKYGANNVVVTPRFRINLGGKEIDVVQIGIGNKKKYVEAVDIKCEVNNGFISVHKHPSIKVGKLFVEPMNYLIRRKAATIKQHYVDEIKKGLQPKPRTKKDIDDFIVMSESMPDFYKKNLQTDMKNFKENLSQYKNIPNSKPINRFTDKAQIITDPFGTSNFFKMKSEEIPLQKRKVNSSQIQRFKLW